MERAMALNYDMTAKQVLVAHCDQHHRRVKTGLRSFAEISKAHAHDHWKSSFLDHIHEGRNDPDQRPPGWYTGKDVILKEG